MTHTKSSQYLEEIVALSAMGDRIRSIDSWNAVIKRLGDPVAREDSKITRRRDLGSSRGMVASSASSLADPVLLTKPLTSPTSPPSGGSSGRSRPSSPTVNSTRSSNRGISLPRLVGGRHFSENGFEDIVPG